MTRTETKKALLALEDGTVYEGTSFGAEGERAAELVFNTSMTGYQEILTDPSYYGQMVTMTYPLIGNYGTNPEDVESRKPWVEAFVVRELSSVSSNWRCENDLASYLKENGVIGMQGVDTRAITRHIRVEGAMKAVISTTDLDSASLVEKARASQGLVGVDLVREVTRGEEERFSTEEKRFHVVAYDFGIKNNILRCLSKRGCEVTVVPASTPPDEILAHNPDGIFLSNGPGDPAAVKYAHENVRELVGKRPVFGICLGHQILALALGGKTFKLKFGHRGANHPVKNLRTGRTEITAQNHGFAADPDSFDANEVELTHINLNDQTLEGFRMKNISAFSVQYHPEASPGPHDSRYLFDDFIEAMKEFRT